MSEEACPAIFGKGDIAPAVGTSSAKAIINPREGMTIPAGVTIPIQAKPPAARPETKHITLPL